MAKAKPSIKAPKKERKEIDWEAIEREYRAGQLFVSEIGRQHGISEGAIRKRAKRDNWKRDLTEQVRTAVRAELVRDGTNEQCADGDLVREKAARGAQVVREHRDDISRLRRIGAVLAERLERIIEGKEPDGIAIGDKESASDMLEKLSRISTRVVQLERQAFNLDEPSADGASAWKRPPGLGWMTTEQASARGWA